MSDSIANFAVGQLVEHKLFGYRGVIYDIDPVFGGTEEWYETMARSAPPKDKPWYHVLVHDHVHTTYVAERNLQADDSGKPILHPALDGLFTGFREGKYIQARTVN